MPVPDHVRRFVRDKFGSKFKSKRAETRSSNPFRDATMKQDEAEREHQMVHRSEEEERGLDLRGGI